MLYHRINDRVFFLLPTMAVGLDVDNKYFVEVAWFNIAIGFGASQ